MNMLNKTCWLFAGSLWSAWSQPRRCSGPAAVAPAVTGSGGDHDRARQALEAGEVLPLRTILDRVEREYPGQVLEVELESDGGRWVYEIRTLRSGGSLVKLKGEARDGTVLGVKAREAGGKRAPGGRNGEEY
jgi:hypothetical protein